MYNNETIKNVVSGLKEEIKVWQGKLQIYMLYIGVVQIPLD